MRHATTFVVLSLALLCGCKSTYEGRYRYSPTPHEVVVRAEGDGETPGAPVARALLSVPGVRDATNGRPVVLEVRLRIENVHAAPVVLLASELQMLDAELEPLGTPLGAAGREPTEVAPGEARMVELLFPFPGDSKPSDYDLDGLSLRWALRYDDRVATVRTTFERRQPTRVYVRDPWYHDPFWPHDYGSIHYRHH